MSEDEFWFLTLKEFNALIERHQTNEEWLNYRPAIICALLANINRGKGSKVYKPQDFMPGAKVKLGTPQTPKQMLATIKVLNAIHGGKVVEKK